MKLSIHGIGLWGPGLTSVTDLDRAIRGAAPTDGSSMSYQPPKPEAIPARERRRAGELINLAVETAHQACEQAGVDKRALPSVFASVLSDTAVTDYMCRKLSAPEKLLSPTKFHNSVHNAASGYWSISAENRAPSNYVCGFKESFGAGLLEATSLALDTAEPVLFVSYDIANAAPFRDFVPIEHSLAAAFVIGPGPTADRTAEANAATPCFELTLNHPAEPESDLRTAALAAWTPGHPGGSALVLAEACRLPAADAAALTLRYTPNRSLILNRLC
ncbi:MAG: beta-ketoacyl synthase chain length factor [Pseudomonadota bacterium]